MTQATEGVIAVLIADGQGYLELLPQASPTEVTPVKLAGALQKQLASLGVRVLSVVMLGPNGEELHSGHVPVSIIMAGVDMPNGADEREARRQYWGETVKQAMVRVLNA